MNLLVSNNVAYGGATRLFAESQSGGWGTNMVFVDNYTTNFTVGIVSSGMSGQYFLDGDSNVFPAYQDLNYGTTNAVSYANGQRQSIWASTNSSIFYTDDTHPNQIPPRAKLRIANLSSFAVPLYLSASLAGTPISMTNGYSGTFYWNSATLSWTPNNPANFLSPPSDLRTSGTN
jgi:hypothetical protein